MVATDFLARGNRFLQRLGIQHPIVLAPMAGFSTPALVAAVADAGGLAMFGAGQCPKEGLVEVVRNTRQIMQKPCGSFGVNLFVPAGFILDPAHWTSEQNSAVEIAASRQMAALSALSGEPVAPPTPPLEKSCEAIFSGQVDAILEEGVQVASFHFGWPAARDAERLRSAGVFLIGNATSVTEAQELERLGADAIIAQGLEAGGHRGTFIDAGKYRDSSLVGTRCLLHAVTQAVSVPVIAAGGVMDGADVAAALAAGASAAQLGTAFLTAAECQAPSLHKRALLRRGAAAAPTVVTQCFTGKPARALVNAWVQDMSDIEAKLPNCFNGMPSGRTLQGAAVKLDMEDYMYMWAGKGYERCRPEMKAVELMAALVSELHATPTSWSKM